MAKPKTRYTCQSCGSVASRWQGQCADCGEWNTLVQESAEVSSIFAAKHNLQGGGRRLEMVGLDVDSTSTPRGGKPRALPGFANGRLTLRNDRTLGSLDVSP